MNGTQQKITIRIRPGKTPKVIVATLYPDNFLARTTDDVDGKESLRTLVQNALTDHSKAHESHAQVLLQNATEVYRSQVDEYSQKKVA